MSQRAELTSQQSQRNLLNAFETVRVPGETALEESYSSERSDTPELSFLEESVEDIEGSAAPSALSALVAMTKSIVLDQRITISQSTPTYLVKAMIAQMFWYRSDARVMAMCTVNDSLPDCYLPLLIRPPVYMATPSGEVRELRIDYAHAERKDLDNEWTIAFNVWTRVGSVIQVLEVCLLESQVRGCACHQFKSITGYGC